MEVIKRDGRREIVHFDKITTRIQNVCSEEELKYIDPIIIAQKTIQSIYNGITTEELDKISAQICHSLTFKHYLYAFIGGRLLISNLYKKTSPSFYETTVKLYEHNDEDNNHNPLVNKEYYNFVSKYKDVLEKAINHDRDNLFDYFGFKTLERAYLLNFKFTDPDNKSKKKMKIIERPQHMWMRVACGIHYKTNDIENAIRTYQLLSQGYFTHATPTLFNSGTIREQNISCFVENTEVMTMEGIKKIQDVNINDKIVTHTGKVKKILQVHKNLLNGRKIMNLDVYKTKPIKVTDNHKFWAISDNNKTPRWVPVSEMNTNYRIAIPSYEGEIKVQKIDIEQLIKDKLIDIKEYIIEDECIIPITKHTSTHLNGGQHINMSFKGNKISKDIFIDEDLANIMGMFIGDGHIMTAKSKVKGVGFTIHKDNLKEINFIKKTMVNVFNIPTVEHHMKTQNVTQLLYNSEILGKLFEYMFGKGFNGKHMWKNMIGWDINLVYNFLAGLITTDGCISKEGNITVQMSNYNLMNELYHLFRLYGIDVSLNEVKNPPKLATVIPWMLSIPKIKYVLERTMKLYNDDRLANCIKKIDQHHRNQTMPTVIDDVKFLKIKSVSVDTNNNPTYVYTLGVEDDHSYNVEGLICENCFLLGTHDSMTGIYKTIFDCAMISKHAGGIGVHISNIRAKGSIIKGTNGISQGIVPMLKVYNETARYVDQGGGKRNGSIAVYIEPHHSDIMDFLDLKKNTGAETERARDLFLALWVSDLYMKVLEKDVQLKEYEIKNGKIKEEDFPDDAKWYLMCPNECPNLPDVYGEEFEKLYYQYVKENRYRRWIRPTELFDKIYEAWIETGVPYIGFKDHVNRKNNQKNSGTIKSSNLCVRGNTYILTENGYIQIEELVDQNVKVWNGCEFSEVQVKKTGENQKLVRVYFSNGYHIDCTKYHKFLLKQSNSLDPKEARRVPASELNMEDKIMNYQLPVNAIDIKLGVEPASNILTVMQDIYVTQIIDLDYLYDTYCFNEPKKNAGVFNTILTGQCIEINEISSENETACCNLCSIAVNKFIKDKTYDFEKLKEVAYQAVFNLNRVIDVNYYPTEEARKSNMKMRPIGLGIQGLSDAYMIMKYPFESNEAMELNKRIMECIYYGGLKASCDLSKVEGPYSEFSISPSAQGILQFDMWGVQPTSGLCDWDTLKEDIKKNGLRNSLITALMPTASTSQILGNNECFEPITANIYYRSTLAGMFNIVNKYLIDDLVRLGLWNDKMKDMILYYNGSIQDIPNIPKDIKELYKTVWEIKQKALIDQARDRGVYVDQAQSMNLFFAEPSQTKLLSAMIYGWKQGLKTGVYYVRTKPATNAIKFTIDSNTKNEIESMLKEEKEDVKFCKIKRKGMTAQELAECEACSG